MLLVVLFSLIMSTFPISTEAVLVLSQFSLLLAASAYLQHKHKAQMLSVQIFWNDHPRTNSELSNPQGVYRRQVDSDMNAD